MPCCCWLRHIHAAAAVCSSRHRTVQLNRTVSTHNALSDSIDITALIHNSQETHTHVTGKPQGEPQWVKGEGVVGHHHGGYTARNWRGDA